MPTQIDWKFCRKCFGLFFDGFPEKGRCPTGGPGHEGLGFMFVVPHLGQPEERFQPRRDAHDEVVVGIGGAAGG